MTPDPLGAIAAACKMYKGEVVRNLHNDITDAERWEYLQQVTKTKLKAPFEFVNFHFLIEGVTRAFTHQMVRQRTAVYAQESLRFAVKEDMPVALPPSLTGTMSTREWYAQDLDTRERDLTEQQQARLVWEEAVDNAENAYMALVNRGVPAEDARGLLPHNVLTRLHYRTDLRALLDHAGNRLCTQAQFEWRLVFTRIIEAIRWNNYTGDLQPNGTNRIKMASELCQLFRPVCYMTGKCEFNANFDRPCSIRDRVQANHAVGRSSDKWHEMYGDPDMENGDMRILPIRPVEWLMDPGAAR